MDMSRSDSFLRTRTIPVLSCWRRRFGSSASSQSSRSSATVPAVRSLPPGASTPFAPCSSESSTRADSRRRAGRSDSCLTTGHITPRRRSHRADGAPRHPRRLAVWEPASPWPPLVVVDRRPRDRSDVPPSSRAIRHGECSRGGGGGAPTGRTGRQGRGAPRDSAAFARSGWRSRRVQGWTRYRGVAATATAHRGVRS